MVHHLHGVPLCVHVVEELRGGLSNLDFQGSILVLGNHEHGKCSDPAFVLGSISSSEAVVDDLVGGDVDRLCDSFPQPGEDLTAGSARSNEVVVESEVERNLTQEHILRNRSGHPTRRLDPRGDSARHGTLRCRAQCSLSNDA